MRKIYGKEDPTRYIERFGYPSIKRPNGKLIWIHAASIGESLAILPIIEQLNFRLPYINILLTTGTLTSAKLLVKKLPANAVHQYIVIDSYFFVSKFIKYWQPELAILVESELWPNLINITADICPILLFNARMSDKSFAKWKIFGFISKNILNKFSLIACQSHSDLKKYQYLGASNAIYSGNIKYANSDTTFDLNQYAILQQQIKNRPVFLAASIHQADDLVILEAYKLLKQLIPNLLIIIAPRHPVRAKQVLELFHKNNFVTAQRSVSAIINDNIDIYLADTIGEMNLFYKIADVVFIGGSFSNGGHNPIEAALFKKPIIWGPDMANFQDLAQEFIDNGAASSVVNYKDLAEHILQLLNKTELNNNVVLNASKIIKKYDNVLDNYYTYVQNYMDKSLKKNK